MKDKYLRFSEVADILGVSRQRVYQLAWEGRIDFSVNEGVKEISQREVERFIKIERKTDGSFRY